MAHVPAQGEADQTEQRSPDEEEEDEAALVAAAGEDLTALLCLDAPVVPEVARAALVDSDYLDKILAARATSETLAPLLASPPAPAEPPGGNTRMLMQLGRAVLAWGRSAFATVDDATYAARLAACDACEHVRPAPEAVLYRVALLGKEGRMCGVCGCVVDRKARMATESCPAEAPHNPGQNRWGQPIRRASEEP
jgi:hypothetical protein